jgi:hypothetical protein
VTKFEELQQAHQRLLDRMDEVSDKAEFAREVQRYITRVCDEAVDVPAPRDRDQLRANLRFWASYVYDATGTYPNTTMRPARLESTSETLPAAPAPARAVPPLAMRSLPQPQPATIPRRAPSRRIWIGILVGMFILGALALTMLLSTPYAIPATGVQATELPSTIETSPLQLDVEILTQGPSPFDPNAWVARIQLSATGGDGYYIFWVNGQPLPEISLNQFTVEGTGCTPERPLTGVTSNGQAVSQEFIITSPLPNCPTP